MAKIKELSVALTNQIAAGEVIERPASVVKELVENAIDANSTEIIVTLKESGLTSISVADNGNGMDSEDALNCFKRYATSKLNQQQELFRIRTLGFRGEAIPSIAAVSQVLLTTSNGSEATEVHYHYGNLESSKPTSRAKGTTITVTNLFSNTPARLRFMKSLPTELSHITDYLNRLAMSYPAVRFEVWHDGNQMLKTVGNGDQQQAIAGIYSPSIARQMIPLNFETADFSVKGFISPPLLSRANRHYMSIFINNRYIKNIAIQQAVLAGYKSTLMIKRFPIVALNIEADPLLVDVNVHPNKLDVRLSKTEQLQESLKTEIFKAVQKRDRIPDSQSVVDKQLKKRHPIELPLKPKEQDVDSFDTISKPTHKNWFGRSYLRNDDKITDHKGYERDKIANEPSSADDRGTDLSAHDISKKQNNDLLQSVAEDHGHKATEQIFKNRNQTTRQDYELAEHLDRPENDSEAVAEKLNDYNPIHDSSFPELEYFGQLHGTYLFAQGNDGFYIIDQHAAQERIRYEYLLKKMSVVKASQQELLLPLTITLSADQMENITAFASVFQKIGLQFEPFGPRSIIFHSYPAWMTGREVQSDIEQVVDLILSKEVENVIDLRYKTAVMMSCKGSIKANHYITPDEARKLLEDLSRTQNPYNCPHGRPTIVHFSTYDMERLFKRIQDH